MYECATVCENDKWLFVGMFLGTWAAKSLLHDVALF
jgi:hypothetical protein